MSNEELVTRIQAGINVAENMATLYNQTKAFIYTIAWKYRGYEELEDLEQEGYLALYDAIDGYQPEEGVKFLTYASHWIRQRMQRYIHNNGSVRIPVHTQEQISQYKKLQQVFLTQIGREPVNKEIGYYMGLSVKQVEQLKKDVRMERIGSLDSLTGEDGETTVGDTIAGQEDVEASVLDEVAAEELKALLWSMVDALPDNCPLVIKARYQEKKTLNALGEQLGISKEWVRQIEAKGMRELRKPSKAKQLRPFAEEFIHCHAYHGRGIHTFNRTWTSSTEYTAMELWEREEERWIADYKRMKEEKTPSGYFS